jgi:hypothetical protein
MNTESTGLKPCTRCGKPLPVTEFREIINKQTGKRRRHSWCNRCKGDYEAAKRAAKGPAFRKAEAARVLAYQSDPEIRARRSKRSSAQYRALASLRTRHAEEYHQLLTSQGGAYKATAVLRQRHREEYDNLYSSYLEQAGLTGG